MISTKTDSTLFQEVSSIIEPNVDRSLFIEKIYPKKPVIVYYDVTRLVSRREKPFATGIDRVDLEYIKQHMARPNIDLRCIALTDDKIQVIQADVIKKYLEDLSKVWSGHTIDSSPTEVLKINDNLPISRFSRFKLKHFGNLRFDQDLFSKKESYEKYYFNASHIGVLSLRNDICDSFLKRFQGRVIAYIHDIIPLTHPDLATKSSAKKLKCYLDNALKFNYTLLFNSISTKQSFNDYYNVEESSYNFFIQYPIVETRLNSFVRQSIKSLPKASYYLTTGTIEPRKNHYFLLKIWKEFLNVKYNKEIPKLVIVGKRGWRNEKTFNLLEDLKASYQEIIELNDASDAEVQYLKLNSKAVLFPSLIEGFNMDFYNSISLGVKVIASAISVHSEVLLTLNKSKNNKIILIDLCEKKWSKALT